VAKPEWGVKRFCGGCGARFYDMRRDPIVCPKCGVTHDPIGLVKSARLKSAVAAKPDPKPVPAEVEDVVDDSDDDDLLIDESDDIDDTDEDAEDDEAIEDPSELGEDKDDMFEVIEKVEGDKSQES